MRYSTSYSSQNPIDAVITWVDGNSDEFMASMEPFLQGFNRNQIPGAHKTRFASVNEIRYCVLSIFKFAPFIRRVFIVTNGQDPKLYDDIARYYPHRVNDVQIVTHAEIFEGYEQYLPTFNSRSIELMLWRIKGLANKFIYFNDDVFLVRDVAPDDFFKGNLPVLRGRWALTPVHRLIWKECLVFTNRILRRNKHYTPRVSYHSGQWNAAKAIGFKSKYFINSHTPHPMDRSVVEGFLGADDDLLQKNISFRFKNHSQFTIFSISYHLQLLNGNRTIEPANLVYMQPHNRSKSYIDKKLNTCDSSPSVKFLCVQSLDMCSKKNQQKVFDWLKSKLSIE